MPLFLLAYFWSEAVIKGRPSKSMSIKVCWCLKISTAHWAGEEDSGHTGVQTDFSVLVGFLAGESGILQATGSVGSGRRKLSSFSKSLTWRERAGRIIIII